MSKIVKITSGYKSTEEYKACINETFEELESMDFVLHELIVRLATAGKWKDWSDQMPIGSEFYFTEEMLRETGDKNVDSLIELWEKLNSLVNEFSQKR